jgi:predicted lipoprotein with Yx(FWY)xxD motif
MSMRAVFRLVLVGFLAGAAAAQDPADAPLPVAISLVRDNGAFAFRDDNGMALYTFDRDPIGASACNGGCADAWPPVAAPAGAHQIGDWTPVRRDDGALQWAYKGRPVYRHQGDIGAGQFNGQGVGGVWRLLQP